MWCITFQRHVSKTAAAESRETIESDLPFPDSLGSGKVKYHLVTLL